MYPHLLFLQDVYLGYLSLFQGSLANTLREVRPTAFMGVPRVWEKMQEKMKAIGAKSSTVRRKVASWAKDVGLHTNLSKMEQYVLMVLHVVHQTHPGLEFLPGVSVCKFYT